MTEQELNQFLQIAREAAENQYKRGNNENGDYTLRMASDLAKDIIRAYRLNGMVKCNECLKYSFNAEERDFIREWGFCMQCDSEYNNKIRKMIEETLN